MGRSMRGMGVSGRYIRIETEVAAAIVARNKVRMSRILMREADIGRLGFHIGDMADFGRRRPAPEFYRIGATSERRRELLIRCCSSRRPRGLGIIGIRTGSA